jgi:hypothetical protein
MYTTGGALPIEREVTSDRNTVLDPDAQTATPRNGSLPVADVGAITLS